MTVYDIYSILSDELSHGKNKFQIQLTPTGENGVGNAVLLGFLQNFLMGIVSIPDDTENRLTTIRFL
jgi:hypothetical protein